MSYNPEQKAILLSLGIEELPPLHYSSDSEAEIQHRITENLPVNQMPVSTHIMYQLASRGC